MNFSIKMFLIPEYNVLQPSPLNEKVLKEKRKKLKETFDRVMRLLHEEEPEVWSEMKRKEVDYEKRKYKRVQYFESVRHAEQVSIEDIPLPSSTNEKPIPATMPKISMPPPLLLTNLPPQTALLKKPDDFAGSLDKDNKERESPGCPATIPPNIFKMLELDSDYESEEKEESEEEIISKEDKHDKNIEEFMKEVETAQKQKEEERATAIALELTINPTPDVDLEEKSNENSHPESEVQVKMPEEMLVMPPQQPIPIAMSPRMPPHALMFRPPPLRPSLPMGIRMPPGPPPHARPLGMNRMGLRMPPGPPLGLPPRHKHHHDRNAPPKQTTTTITAKPQIRNLSADVTRFVPTTLRTKRDEPRKTKPKFYIPETQYQPKVSSVKPQPNKDDAYKQFMNELNDLL